MNLWYIFFPLFFLDLVQSFEAGHRYVAPSYDGESSSGNRLKMKLKEFHKRYSTRWPPLWDTIRPFTSFICWSYFYFLWCSTASFTAIDRNYLTPFFTTQSADEEGAGKIKCLSINDGFLKNIASLGIHWNFPLFWREKGSLHPCYAQPIWLLYIFKILLECLVCALLHIGVQCVLMIFFSLT